ncbi:MAG: hypothetical protein WC467_00995 [Patescibacteria group bacterium]
MYINKQEIRVVFWHNDFSDELSVPVWYGKDGPVATRLAKLIPSEIIFEWEFRGGFIRPGKNTLIESLEKADVIICAYARNMDIENDHMHWHGAEHSLLAILKSVKKKNKNIKIFFAQTPFHLLEKFNQIGTFVPDLNDKKIDEYFKSLNR